MDWIHRIFLQIYISPLPLLLGAIGAVSVLFLLAQKRWAGTAPWRWTLVSGLVLWFVAVVCSTVAARTPGNAASAVLPPLQSYREVLNGGNPEILRSNLMNVLLFYPAGMALSSLLPRKMPGWARIVTASAALGLFSIGIEYFQFALCLGRAETDDVLHNTLGSLLGGLWAQIPIPGSQTRIPTGGANPPDEPANEA